MARNGTVCQAGSSRIAARFSPANPAQAISTHEDRTHCPPRRRQAAVPCPGCAPSAPGSRAGTASICEVPPGRRTRMVPIGDLPLISDIWHLLRSAEDRMASHLATPNAQLLHGMWRPGADTSNRREDEQHVILATAPPAARTPPHQPPSID